MFSIFASLPKTVILILLFDNATMLEVSDEERHHCFNTYINVSVIDRM